MCYIWLNGSTLIIWSKIWDQLLFLCFPFDYNHQCDWLLELGLGQSNVLKRDEKTWVWLELRRKQRIFSPRPQSGNDSSWSDFSTSNFLSHSSNASPGHFAVKTLQLLQMMSHVNLNCGFTVIAVQKWNHLNKGSQVLRVASLKGHFLVSLFCCVFQHHQLVLDS